LVQSQQVNQNKSTRNQLREFKLK